MSGIKLSSAVDQGKYDKVFKELYPHPVADSRKRYQQLINEFVRHFGDGDEELSFFSAPGRTELGGNHTDHQQGRVLASAVDLDVIGIGRRVAAPKVSLYSEGFGLVEVDLSRLDKDPKEENTSPSLIRGIAFRLQQLGHIIGGFECYAQSLVPVGSGLSSSAAYENLIATAFNALYNEERLSGLAMAQISQFAENVYFGKPSGLMDQATSGIGGMIGLDFKDPTQPVVVKMSFDPKDYGHTLCIVATDGDHADLTQDYGDINYEMGQVAGYFNKRVLRQVEEEAFIKAIPQLRRQFGDRAVVRSLHIFQDNRRVEEQMDALNNRDFNRFKRLVNESGTSSFMQLQNIFSPARPKTQPLTLALCRSQQLLEPVGGAWRVHGGGFGGTIQAYVPTDHLPSYSSEMNRLFGQGACQAIGLRQQGSIALHPSL